MLGPDRMTLVKGHAGTGKTTALRAVASAWQARGVEVLAGAPSGKATQELGRIEGRPGRDALGLGIALGARRDPEGPLHLPHGRGRHGRRRAVGPHPVARARHGRQARRHRRPGAAAPRGRPLWLGGGGVRGPRDPGHRPGAAAEGRGGPRGPVTALARGANGIQAGLDHFLAKGAVRLEPDVLENPIAALAGAYWAGPENASRIALAYSNRDVDALNAAIRAAAVAKGRVDDANAIAVTIARERRVRVAGGARVWRRDETIRIGTGDRVLLTRPAPEIGLPRSGFGTVTKVAEGRIEILVDGREDTVTIDPAAFPHLDHGFAATVHKAQGMTADLVSVLPHARMDGTATYVALSRHRDRVTVFGRRRHMETAEQFHRMGVRVAAPPMPKTERGRAMVPLPESATTDRQDWQDARRSAAAGPLPGLAGRRAPAVGRAQDRRAALGRPRGRRPYPHGAARWPGRLHRRAEASRRDARRAPRRDPRRGAGGSAGRTGCRPRDVSPSLRRGDPPSGPGRAAGRQGVKGRRPLGLHDVGTPPRRAGGGRPGDAHGGPVAAGRGASNPRADGTALRLAAGGAGARNAGPVPRAAGWRWSTAAPPPERRCSPPRSRARTRRGARS